MEELEDDIMHVVPREGEGPLYIRFKKPGRDEDDAEVWVDDTGWEDWAGVDEVGAEVPWEFMSSRVGIPRAYSEG